MADSETTYFMARITLKYGTNKRWFAVMPKMKAEFEKQGWRMHLGLVNVVGEVTEVVHIWEVPDANNVWPALQAVRSSEALAEVGPELLEIMLDEKTQLKAKAPYSP